jgi:hypothetical protein
LPFARWSAILGRRKLSVQEAGKNIERSIFPFFPCSGFLRGDGESLLLKYFDYVVLLWVEFANLGHRCIVIFAPNLTSPGISVFATWAYSLGMYGNSPIGYVFFVACADPLCGISESRNIVLTLGDCNERKSKRHKMLFTTRPAALTTVGASTTLRLHDCASG